MDEQVFLDELNALLVLIDQLSGQLATTDKSMRSEELTSILTTIRARVKKIYLAVYPTAEDRMKWVLAPLHDLDPEALPRLVRQLQTNERFSAVGLALQRLALFIED